MKKIFVIALCLFSQNCLAAPVENAMVDPTLMTDALKQGIEVINATRQHNEQSKNSTPENQKGLGDPTRMNQNFRDALNSKMNSITDSTNNNAPVPEKSTMPRIRLIGKANYKNDSKTHAMLRVNRQSELVSVGEKITFLNGDILTEIEILEITKRHVKVNVVPSNKILFLR
jgi:sRNA-binding protein